MRPLFTDRQEAGRLLADALIDHAGRPDVIVLALPPGGVPVAAEVAEVLQAPLDLLLVRRMRLPGREELVLGLVAEGGVRVLDQAAIEALPASPGTVDALTATELVEIRRRARLYRGERPPPPLQGRRVVLVTDGLASGGTMAAAAAAVRRMRPARLVVATPAASAAAITRVQAEADEVVFLESPEPFVAVGRWYRDFPAVADGEVRALLEAAPRPAA